MSDLDEKPGWHEELPMRIGAAVMGMIVPWVAGIVGVLLAPVLFGDSDVPWFSPTIFLGATVLAGFGLGWNRYLPWMIGGFAVWGLKDILLGFPTGAIVIGVGIGTIGYFVGGLARKPFQVEED